MRQVFGHDEVISEIGAGCFMTRKGLVIEGNFCVGDNVLTVFDKDSRRYLPIFKKRVSAPVEEEPEKVMKLAEEIFDYLVFYLKANAMKFTLIKSNEFISGDFVEKDAIGNGFDISVDSNGSYWPFVYCCVPFEYLYESGGLSETKNIYIIGLGFKLNLHLKFEGPPPEYENYSYLSDGGSDPGPGYPTNPVYFYVFDIDSGRYYYIDCDEDDWWAYGWSAGFNVNGNKIYYHNANESLLKVFQFKDGEIVLIKSVNTNWENGLFVSADGYFYGWDHVIVGQRNTSWYPNILYELTNHDLTGWVALSGEKPKLYKRLNIETGVWEEGWYDELTSNSNSGVWKLNEFPYNQSADFAYSQNGKRWYIKSDGKKLVMDYILYDIDASGNQQGVYTEENLGGPPEHPTWRYHFTLDEKMSGDAVAKSSHFAKVYVSFSRSTNKHLYYTYTKQWDENTQSYKTVEETVEDNESVDWTPMLDLSVMRFPFVRNNQIFCQYKKNGSQVSANLDGHWSEAEGYVKDCGSRSYEGQSNPYYFYSPYEEFALTRENEWIEYGWIYSEGDKLIQSLISGAADGFHPIIYLDGERIENDLASKLGIVPKDIMGIVYTPGLDKDPNIGVFK